VQLNVFTEFLRPVCPLNATLPDLTVIFEIDLMGLDEQDYILGRSKKFSLPLHTELGMTH
jgi:hypothetical protein